MVHACWQVWQNKSKKVIQICKWKSNKSANPEAEQRSATERLQDMKLQGLNVSNKLAGRQRGAEELKQLKPVKICEADEE